MWEARQGLPIIAMEQEVVELINENDVVVLCGETGCGKTTQARTPLFPHMKPIFVSSMWVCEGE